MEPKLPHITLRNKHYLYNTYLYYDRIVLWKCAGKKTVKLNNVLYTYIYI